MTCFCRRITDEKDGYARKQECQQGEDHGKEMISVNGQYQQGKNTESRQNQNWIQVEKIIHVPEKF